MKILISGNKDYGIAQALDILLPENYHCTFASRTTGYDLVHKEGKDLFIKHSLDCDVVVNNAALHNFHQTLLARDIIDVWRHENKQGYLINIGSSADRAVKSGSWLYPIEKAALREYSANLSSDCIWNKSGIRCTYLSFGTVDTPKVVAKHPDRAKLTMSYAAKKILWLMEQPTDANISIMNIDPINL